MVSVESEEHAQSSVDGARVGDEALRWGSSGECQAFASPCLMDMEEFACESVELWRMIV